VKRKLKYCFIGAGIVLFAVCAILLYILAPNYLDHFLLFSFGFVLCGVAIEIMKDTYSCKEKVSAVLVDYGYGQIKSHRICSPVFTYQYQGKTYTSVDVCSQRYALTHYKKGETYTIYLSPQNPSLISLQRKISIFVIALFLIGLTIMILSIWSIF